MFPPPDGAYAYYGAAAVGCYCINEKALAGADYWAGGPFISNKPPKLGY
jgi:hypothetical protein